MPDRSEVELGTATPGIVAFDEIVVYEAEFGSAEGVDWTELDDDAIVIIIVVIIDDEGAILNEVLEATVGAYDEPARHDTSDPACTMKVAPTLVPSVAEALFASVT